MQVNLEEHPNELWEDCLEGENKMKYLFVAEGLLQRLSVKEVSITSDYYKDAPLREEHKTFNTYNTVFVLDDKEEITLSIVEFAIGRKYDSDFEYVFRDTFLVDGYRESFSSAKGIPVRDAFGLSSQESETEFLMFLLDDFDIQNTFFKRKHYA